MQGGVVGSLFFLAILLFSGVKSQDLLNKKDLKHGGPNELIDSEFENAELSREDRLARAIPISVGGISQANADAHALAESAANPYLQGLYGPQLAYPLSGYGSAAAEANALAQTASGGILGSGIAQAEALANAQSNSLGGGPLSGYLSPYSPYTPSSAASNAQAQASSIAMGRGNLNYLPSQANAEAHALAESAANSYLPGIYGPQIAYPWSGYGSAAAEANALAQTATGGISGSSIAQAEALANAQSNSLGGGPLSGYLSPYSPYIPSSAASNAQAQASSLAMGRGNLNYLPSQANAEAHALAESAANSNLPGIYSPRIAYPWSGYGSAAAEANALAQTATGGISGSSIAQAEALANAQSNSLGGGPLSGYLSPYSPYIPSSAASNAQAQASSIAMGRGNLNYLPSQANAEAHALAESAANSYLPGIYGPQIAYPWSGYGSAAAEANALAQTATGGISGSSIAQAEALANAQSNSLGGGPLSGYLSPYSPYIPSSAASNAQAQASSIAMGRGNLNYLPSQANAEAHALAESAANSYLPGVYGPQIAYPWSGYGSAAAEANALAQTASGGILGSGIAQAEALANAQSNSLGGGPLSGYLSPYSPYIPSSAASNAQAQASSIAMGRGNLNYLPSQANAEAHALAESAANSYLPGIYTPRIAYPWSGYGSAAAEANALAQTATGGISGSSIAQAEALANAHSNSLSGGPLSGYLSPYSSYIPSSAASSAQAQALASGIVRRSINYLPSYANTNAHALAESAANSHLQGLYGPLLAYPSSGYGSAAAEANALAQTETGGISGSSIAQAEALANAQSNSLGGGPLSGYLSPYSPYIPSSAASNAQAQALASGIVRRSINYLPSHANTNAHALAESAANSYLPGIYSPRIAYPWSGYGSAAAEANAIAQTSSGGIRGSSVAQAEALANAHSNYVGRGPLSGYLSPYSPYIPSSAASNAQAQALASGIVRRSINYLPSHANTNAHAMAESAANSYLPGIYGPRMPYPWSGYGSAASEANALAQTSSGGIRGSSVAQAEALANAHSNYVGRGPLSGYLSPYSSYIPSSAASNAQAQALASGIVRRSINYLPSHANTNAHALAESAANSHLQGHYGPLLAYPSSGYGSAAAEANALAQTATGGISGSSIAQAEALANAQSNSLGGGPLSGYLSPYSPYIPSSAASNAQAHASSIAMGRGNLNYLPSQANAEAHALAESAANSNLPGIYSPRIAYPWSGYGSAAAEANALAQTATGGISGSSIAQAEALANAHSNSLGGGPLSGYLSPYSPYIPSSAASNAQAQASSIAMGRGNLNYLPSQANAEAHALAESAANSYLPGIYGPQIAYPWSGYGSAAAEANALAQTATGGISGSSIAQAEALANAQSNSLGGGPLSGYLSPYSPYIPSSAASNAQAQASSIAMGRGNLNYLPSQANAEAHALAESAANSYLPGIYSPRIAYPWSGYGSAAAEANALAQTATGGISGSSIAQAEALANAQSNSLGGGPLSGYLSPYSPYIPSSAASNAQAQASSIAMGRGNLNYLPSQANAEAHALAESAANSYLPGIYTPRIAYPWSGYGSAAAEANALAQTATGGISGSSIAQAEALANAQSNSLGGGPLSGYLSPYSPYIPSSAASNAQAQASSIAMGRGNLNYLPSQANAEAHALAESAANSYLPGIYGPQIAYPWSGYGSAAAEANALAQTAAGGISGSSIAQAEALANAHSNSLGGGPLSGYLSPYSSYIPSSAASNAQAQALASGIVRRSLSYLPSHANANAHALAESAANSHSQGLYGPLLAYPSSGYGSAAAEANALAHTASGGIRGSSVAQAEALANAQSNYLGRGPVSGYLSPYSSYIPSSAASNAQAQTSANRIVRRSINYLPSQANTNAHALAESAANSHLRGLYGPQSAYPLYGYGSPYMPSSGVAESQAQAQAQAQGQGLSQGQSQAQSQSQSQSLGQGGYQSQSQAQSQAQTQSQGHGQGQAQSQAQSQTQSQSLGHGLSQSQAQAQSEVQAIGMSPAQAAHLGLGNAQSAALTQALAGAKTRVIPSHEYVHPYQLPGFENVIRCSREGEFHNFWSSTYECLLCACINQNGYLRPVCARCSGCIPPVPVPLPPPPQADSQVSCNPLPAETPFENPLNPCQICVCHLSLDRYGRSHVDIVCQDIQGCSAPEIIVPIPPRTLPPTPIPMPLCRNFPTNVKIPHPQDACSICKCVIGFISSIIPQHEIICSPRPECELVPEPLPVTEPIPIPLPDPEYIPLLVPEFIPTPLLDPEYIPAPIPVPEIISVLDPEDLPAPPPMPEFIPIPDPVSPSLRPGPLPGPLPHNSCRPYVPNQPFLHPWDECQECVCNESFGRGVVNVEVNCYTIRACCTELLPVQQLPHISPVIPLSPWNRHLKVLGAGPLYPGNSISSADAYANAQSSALSPHSSIPALYPFIPLPGSSTSSAEAAALANTNVQGLALSPYQAGYIPGRAQAAAEAQAQANSGLLPYFSPGGYSPINYGSASAEAEATANSGYGQYLPIGLPNTLSLGSAEAEAIANANSGYNPWLPGYLSGSSASALANAQSNTNLGIKPLRSTLYPNINPSYQSLASAEAEAMANANSGYNTLLPGYLQNSGSSASAEAEAFSGANSGLSPFGLYPYSNLGAIYPVSSGSANAEAISSADSGYNSWLPGSAYPLGNSASALANAEAISGANIIPSPFLTQPYSGIGSPYQSSALSEAEAVANAGILSNSGLGSSASALAHANALSNSANPLLYQPNILNPFGLTSSSAEAEAVANANSGLTSGYGPVYIPNLLPAYQTGSSAVAQAEAAANTNTGYNPFSPGQLYPYGSVGVASAEAEAIANANSGYSPYLNLYQPGYASSAEAEAAASANSGYSRPGVYPGGIVGGANSHANALSEAYGKSYPYSPWNSHSNANAEAAAQVNSILSGAQGMSQAQAQSHADTFGQGQSSAQSQAMSSGMSGWPLIKSGNVGDLSVEDLI